MGLRAPSVGVNVEVPRLRSSWPQADPHGVGWEWLDPVAPLLLRCLGSHVIGPAAKLEEG
jgi:hypothetical protein